MLLSTELCQTNTFFFFLLSSFFFSSSNIVLQHALQSYFSPPPKKKTCRALALCHFSPERERGRSLIFQMNMEQMWCITWPHKYTIRRSNMSCLCRIVCLWVCVCVCVRVCAWFSSQKCSYDAFSHAGVIIIKQTNKQKKAGKWCNLSTSRKTVTLTCC